VNYLLTDFFRIHIMDEEDLERREVRKVN
jgi:hypothetical protein